MLTYYFLESNVRHFYFWLRYIFSSSSSFYIDANKSDRRGIVEMELRQNIKHLIQVEFQI